MFNAQNSHTGNLQKPGWSSTPLIDTCRFLPSDPGWHTASVRWRYTHVKYSVLLVTGSWAIILKENAAVPESCMHVMSSDWLTSVLKGQEPSGFCFSHFFHQLVFEYTHLFSCHEWFYDYRKGIKHFFFFTSVGEYATECLISINRNQKLVRTNGRG